MIINKLVKTFARVLLVPAIVSCCSPSLPCQSAATPASVTPDSVLGTWKGESICVGDRPACKNEVVVYRFEAVAGKPGVVLLLADKIIEGKRVPMGKLEFLYDEGKIETLLKLWHRSDSGFWLSKMA